MNGHYDSYRTGVVIPQQEGLLQLSAASRLLASNGRSCLFAPRRRRLSTNASRSCSCDFHSFINREPVCRKSLRVLVLSAGITTWSHWCVISRRKLLDDLTLEGTRHGRSLWPLLVNEILGMWEIFNAGTPSWWPLLVRHCWMGSILICN